MTTGAPEIESDRRTWYLGKEIPIAVLIGLGLQTAGIVWWASGQTKDTQNVLTRMGTMETKFERLEKTVQDSAVPSALTTLRVDILQSQFNALKADIDALKAKGRH